MTGPVDTPDRIQTPEQITFAPFALPGFSGDNQAAFLNTDTAVAPFIALLKLAAGGVLAKHYHTEAVEAVYVVEGTMINDGVPLPAGSILTHGPGVWHGPHTTQDGCTLMFMQYPGVGPADSVFV
jgi:quercetin dioxygenase-like cupin family protein